MTDIFSLKVEEIVSKIKDAQLTSVEVCQTYIERINNFEKDVKAWAHFDKKLLLEKAKESDEHRRSGKPTGPLHGIPVALKDIIGTVDMPTECGTPIRKGKSYSQNAEIVDLLLSAGAIVMGKTATSELAYLGPSKTTNPHDYSRTPGGSQVDQLRQLHLLCHHYQSDLRLVDQLLDPHLIVEWLVINHLTD
jgi:Asp-tRNA(Asn)/Glu-tRNA(Gln) amidotransferase A subunit family amidase